MPNDPHHVLVLQYADTTLIALNRPTGGTWTVIQNPGSTAVATVAYARGLAPAQVKARVGGRGRARTLTYTATPAPGRVITFIERGSRTYRILGVAHGSHGRIRFTPADGSPGRRTIVALVEQNGIQTHSGVVAHYTAPRPQRPARPSRVGVTHSGFTLNVSWSAVPGAALYEVLVKSSDGAPGDGDRPWPPCERRGHRARTTRDCARQRRVRRRAARRDDPPRIQPRADQDPKAHAAPPLDG